MGLTRRLKTYRKFQLDSAFYTLTEAQILIERWRQQYNTVRPHSALGYRPPAPVTVIPAAFRSLEMSPTLS